ncbi:FeoB-associated Cys-rich membrane protein [Eubacteriales bacterium OttesenSCG-928-G02]|nr:FeoB-associated Cys-rich membrane protein [Eubacteriales bacterium OttesenSCG-928-G02]
MMNFITNYGGTILIIIALMTVVFLIIRKLVKNKKEGIKSCGCNCENCPKNNNCH